MNNYTLPTDWSINIYPSALFGGLCANLVAPNGNGLLFPVPADGLTQNDIDAAVNEITNPESAPLV